MAGSLQANYGNASPPDGDDLDFRRRDFLNRGSDAASPPADRGLDRIGRDPNRHRNGRTADRDR
ncbi:MAG: hypothetical protein AAGF12_37175, partial [Myxococcota bacterium]